MKITTIALAATALLATAAAHAQTQQPPIGQVPAIPGINLPPQSQVVRPATAPALPTAPAAVPGAVPSPVPVPVPVPVTVPASGAVSPAAPAALPFAAKARRRPAPPPSPRDIATLERQLSIARSQAIATRVTEQGTVRGERANYLRAKTIFPFSDKSVFEVITSPERMTAIELQPGEKIITKDNLPRAADTVNWVVSTVESGAGDTAYTTVLVKPMYPDQQTNMVIPTNRRSYYLVARTDSAAYMPIVGFSYPFDEAQAEKARAQAAEIAEARKEPVALAPDQLRFGYSISQSSVAWRPVRVFDDGSKTYIQMPASMRSAEAPALFVMEADNEPMLVNYRVKGDYYIVDRLFDKAQLRVGTRSFVDIVRGADPQVAQEQGFLHRLLGAGSAQPQ